MHTYKLALCQLFIYFTSGYIDVKVHAFRYKRRGENYISWLNIRNKSTCWIQYERSMLPQKDIFHCRYLSYNFELCRKEFPHRRWKDLFKLNKYHWLNWTKQHAAKWGKIRYTKFLVIDFPVCCTLYIRDVLFVAYAAKSIYRVVMHYKYYKLVAVDIVLMYGTSLYTDVQITCGLERNQEGVSIVEHLEIFILRYFFFARVGFYIPYLFVRYICWIIDWRCNVKYTSLYAEIHLSNFFNRRIYR